MRVAVVNFSGNVGKSTLSKHLLAPRMNTELITVETINSDEGGENLAANQFDELQGHLLVNDVVLVDVGASNIERFVHAMSQYRKSHEDFDYFIVPVVGESKQQKDTVATIDALAALGVPAKKIRILFNKIETTDSVETIFAPILHYAAAEKRCIANPEAVVYANDVYETSKALGKTVSELVEDPTDYRAQLKKATDPDERAHCVDMILAKRLAAAAHENLDAAFAAAFK